MQELKVQNFIVDSTGKEVPWGDLDQDTKTLVANDLTSKMAEEIGM